MYGCNKICPYKKDGKCSNMVPAKSCNPYFFLEAQCPYFEKNISSSIAHKKTGVLT